MQERRNIQDSEDDEYDVISLQTSSRTSTAIGHTSSVTFSSRSASAFQSASSSRNSPAPDGAGKNRQPTQTRIRAYNTLVKPVTRTRGVKRKQSLVSSSQAPAAAPLASFQTKTTTLIRRATLSHRAMPAPPAILGASVIMHLITTTRVLLAMGSIVMPTAERSPTTRTERPPMTRMERRFVLVVGEHS
jgi:hypothetical protein